MRGSRRFWLTLACCLAAALLAIPIAVRRDRAASTAAGGEQVGTGAVAIPQDWTTFTPDDRAFQVTGPADARTAVLSTSLGPARKTTFAGGDYSVTWLALPTGLDDQQALEQG